MRSLALIGALLLLGPVDAQEAAPTQDGPLDVLGLTLGQPFSVSECTFSTYSTGLRIYESDYRLRTFPCFKHGYSGPKPGEPVDPAGERVTIIFADAPSGFDRTSVLGHVVAGKLEGAYLPTFGVNVQADVLALLTEKYGAPTSSETEQVQNRMGASFEQLSASWRFKNLSVDFAGMGGRVNSGSVHVRTAAGDQFLEREVQERKAREPKL